MSEKLKQIPEISEIAEEIRASGRKIVLAHGVFDVLHVGHKRHLEEGSGAGDILIVTLTCDEHVNKGPDRPIFPDTLRSEMVAALNFVDYVAISPEPSAEYVINLIKPDVYLKGKEYADEIADVTGKIKLERETVEKHGGKIFYTDDIVFSSSNLSNRVFSTVPEETDQFLREARSQYTYEDFAGALEGLKQVRCLYIGDSIIDEYVYVEPLGKPSKENIISTKYKESEVFCGGVVATANAGAAFCGHVDLVTILGGAQSDEDLIRTALHDKINLNCFYRPSGQTTRKVRLVDPGYMRKLFELSYLDDRPIDGSLLEQVKTWLAQHLSEYDLVVVNDFGHGLIDGDLVDVICEKARFLALNVQTNSANRGFNLVTKYPRADYICIDEPEVRLAAADRFSPLGDVVKKIKDRMHMRNVVVTSGRKGCQIFTEDGTETVIPAFVGDAIDTMGAGDAFFAVSAPLVANGTDPVKAAFIGNAVGAMQVRVVGHRESISSSSVLKYIARLLK